MNVTFIALMEAALVALSLSIDAFTAGFAYGGNNIRIPVKSIQIISFICSAITGLSLFAGMLLVPYLPGTFTVAAAFAILFVIGLVKLLDSITKALIRKYGDLSKEIKLSMFNFKFILNLYADPEKADIDSSKDITPMEASALALSLSLDGIAVGFGAALINVNGLAVFMCSFITNAAAIALGHLIGAKIAANSCFNISWISGAVLICLAFSKLLQ